MTRLRFATLLLCAAAMTAHARAPQWSFVDLGTLGSDTSVASAVSNRGDVAGYSITPVTGGPPGSPTALMHAFVWRNGALTDLGDPGRDGVAIYDMNENGMLVGYGVNTGVVTWKDGQWATLGFDGSPHAINNSGMIVGQHGFGVHVQAFVYTGTALLGLGTFGGTDSSALGVNDRGQVVGYSYAADGQSHAFLWQEGIVTDLGTFGGQFTQAIDINNQGVILGTMRDPSTGKFIAFTWDGVMRRLFTAPNGMEAFPRAMNDRGDVVGQLTSNSGAMGFAFFDSALTLLDQIPEVVAAGFHDLNPSKINERRWIVGTARNANGSYRGFLLIKRMLK